MSTSIYNQQPPTSGKVILETSSGEIEIELWCNETPKTCKNFITLCLEGYYDDTIFHRLIKDFMIQGGDPSGTGRGGESIYGEPFADEFHQRLKFTQRGLVAMANSGELNDNGSQFFITFKDCDWLNKKHTIFGKVIGQTIYNLVQLQDLEVDENHRPLQPPKIKKARVIKNPFDDLVIRNLDKSKKVVQNRSNPNAFLQGDDEDDGASSSEDEALKKKQAAQIKKFKKRQKPQKKANLLSFGDEDDDEQNDNDKEEQEEEIDITNNAKLISSHDVVNSAHLSKETAVNMDELEKKRKKEEEEKLKLQNLKDKLRKPNLKEESKQKNKKLKLNQEDLKNLDKGDSELQGYKTRINKKTGKTEIYWENSSDSSSGSSGSDDSDSDSEEYVNAEQKKIRQKQKDEYEKLKLDELKFKRGGIGSHNTAYSQRVKHEHKLLSNVEKRRLKFEQQEKIKRDNVLNRLQDFKKKLSSSDVKDNKNYWANHKLKFHIDSQRAYSIQDNKNKAQDIEQDKPQNNDDQK